ncbi:LysM domain-containing protein [Arthrobacter sp. NicSoilB8]|uniref:LysM peptidoglycan-binding domain-containing protein n=1 Tax=Arthrobacter sp. NicSoilB8 TaxID=2830998 RepID=UPI001CC59709|nr:LysM domain-containing protein [Arthrobacter sp. NicSoilB8]
MDRTAAPRPRSRQTVRADAAMALVILLLGVFLATTGNSLVQRWHVASARQQSLSFEDQLGIAANTAGLIIITWWVLSLAIAVAAGLLDCFGKTRAAAATGRFSPAFMRRLVLAAVGLQLLTAPLATAATPHDASGPGQAPQLATATPAAVSAAWMPSAARTPEPVPGPVPAPQGPAGASAVDARWKPRSPIVDAGPLAARHMRANDSPGAREVTVRAGDSLWSIAAAALGPFASDADIAREWPRLYASNREAIGANPHFLRPGQVLVLPPER